MDPQEGLEYKKQLLDLIRKAGINNISELTSESIDSDSTSEDENSSATESNIANSAGGHIEREDMCDFRSKIIEMKHYFDEFPTLAAQLNTELEMMANEPRVIAASSANDPSLEQFIWKFDITFEWEEKNILLPIQDASEITALNSALTDELIYHAVVSFICQMFTCIFYGRLMNYVFSEYFQQYDHLVFVYGTNKLRNMSIASRRLFHMLISERCHEKLSWTGKGPSGRNQKLAFKDLTNIQRILIEVLNVADKNYTQQNLHEDIVYKILKPKLKTKN